MDGVTSPAAGKRRMRTKGGNSARRNSGRPIPRHSELWEFIQTEMRRCSRFEVRVYDSWAGSFMDTDQIRAHRSRVELDRGDWAPTRPDSESAYRTQDMRVRASAYGDVDSPHILDGSVLRQLELGRRQFMARTELDHLVSNEMYRLEDACLAAGHLDVFATLDLLNTLPPELWVRLLDIETHHLDGITSSRVELMRFDAPALLDLEPEFGFIHPIEVVVRCGDADIEMIPFDGLFDDSRQQVCVSAWVMSSLGIEPDRIARVVSRVVTDKDYHHVEAPGDREVRTTPAAPVERASAEQEPDYECDCPCYGSTCSNEYDDMCEMPWLRKEY